MPINKRWIAVFVALTFLFSLVPAGSLVAPVQAAEQARGQISMEEALRIAKGHFAVDSRLDVFSSGFNEFDGSPRWRFNWRDSKGQFGEVSVEINAATGEVVSYHSYNPREHEDSPSRGFLPKISDEEGLKIAQGFIGKLTNRKASDFRLLPSNQQQSLQRGIKFLEYSYIGLVNGIPYPNNKLVVSINGDTGELKHFYYHWDSRGSFPTARKVNAQQGLELVKKELEVELVYFKGFDRSGTKPIQLVYQFKNPGEIMIDAATGQLVKHGDHFFPMHFQERMKSLDAGAGGDFTPQEQLELEKMAGLINQEEARAIATKLFPQAAELNLQHSSLSRDWEFPQLVVWRFNWNRESAERFEWLEVEVDAKTGEVIGFNRHGNQRDHAQLEPENYKVKNRADAQKLAESYIREIS